jgi:transcriptional regulator with XRE-family HTH domain
MDLGSELRTARERAGFSLSELASRTKIPQRSLRAIEENDFASVPPGIFARSFIRTYAREVGVDPEEAIAEFRSMTEPAPQEDKGADGEIVDEQLASRSFALDLSESRPGWGYALMAAALLVAVISVNRYASKNQPDALTTDTSVTRDEATDTSVAVATTGDGIRLEMRAQGPCWVRAVVDGQLAFARLLKPGETEMLSGRRDIILRVGDPAALSYSINGRPGTTLGSANRAVTVRFDASGGHTPIS